ncbi:MAG: hypothetical protein MSD68_15995 [Blautia sp.]|uniref:hypothetical protein n=1 Tax=Blautia sp. TaxID=1955243 RepID=UPI0025B98AC8|nr:hypothetical protein [Blautia sp.]MCI7451159.1 hypothetical protein [Blautia sp.]
MMQFWETDEGFQTGRLMSSRLMTEKKQHCKLIFANGPLKASAEKIEKEINEILSAGGKYISHIALTNELPFAVLLIYETEE